MSISQDSAATIVCREVFDETSHPSKEEILDYAKRLGIDPETEPHLLDLAREGLMAALPKGWSPCYHEASGAWYYYQASTRTTAWEHPLDAVYRELVEQTRAGNRQSSIDEDSKTIAKELDSHEEATLSKKSCAPKNMVTTKIPVKLAPLKRPEKTENSRKRDVFVTEKHQSRRDTDTRTDSSMSLASDRASRDYTNLKFQDPRFYECPKLLESPKSSQTSTPRKELDLKEVFRRSESLSPRHEKDWEQLSSRFSSEENIIDIDKLSASFLRSDRHEKFDKEKHPSQLGQQKELTLSGSGSMFLKKNRSRDNTPSQEAGKLEEFRYQATQDEPSNVPGDRPKSILREKQSEDDARPVDEERKSVRFDLERKPDVQFSYSGADNDFDSDTDTWEHVDLKPVGATKPEISGTQTTKNGTADVDTDEPDAGRGENGRAIPKNSIVVGKRFVVQNVSENEHFNQISREDSKDELSAELPPNKFGRIRNIDIVSKSETDSSVANNSSDQWPVRNQQISRQEIPENIAEDPADDGSAEDEEQKDRQRVLADLRRSFDEEKEWLKKRHEEEMENMRKEFVVKLEERKNELEEHFSKQTAVLRQNMEKRLEEFKRELADKEEREIQKLIAEMDEAKLENLKKMQAELEVCYEKERQEIVANLKTELDDRKKELLELRNQEMGKLEDEFERDLGEEKLAKVNEYVLTRQHSEKIEALKEELDKELEDLRSELRLKKREKVAKITEDHDKRMAEIERTFKIDENLTRKMYKQQLEEPGYSPMEIEKMLQEKSILQEKYTALKEKYMKLKNDVRLAVERRSKRKEGYTTASETERSASTRTRTEKTESSEQNTPMRIGRPDSSRNVRPPVERSSSERERGGDVAEMETGEPLGFQKSVDAADARTATKFESDDATTASESNANTMKRRKTFTKRAASVGKINNSAPGNNNNIENPVENIRKQLEKLEEIGDQLPSNETAYTLRYPFQDKAPANVSSELEFFRHRIHVERDSVRRAREALREQRSALQGRQRAWKQRSARATLEQLVQEERELSDMEISLHRTRSLLGEKVIHLRHLEQSLERMANSKKSENDASTKNDELTLSDMSSASSGFSSTDLATDTFADKADHYQESTEIIASLENLNSEIREIWGVLNKRQDSNIPSPPTLMYSYLRWLRFHHLTAQPTNVQASFGTPNIQSNILSQLGAGQAPTTTTTTTTHNIIAQYGPNSRFSTSVGTVERNASNLMERTRNLRDWLRQARMESADIVSPGQATL